MQFGSTANQKNQQFILVTADNGHYQIVARHSGSVIEVAGAGTNNGDNIQQWENVNQDNSHWEVKKVVITGLTQMDENGIFVYPNPAESVVNIGGINPQDKIELYSLSGLLVTTNTGGSVNVEDLAGGTYVLKIYTNNQMIIKRIVKH